MCRTVWLVQTDVAKYHSSPFASNLLVVRSKRCCSFPHPSGLTSVKRCAHTQLKVRLPANEFHLAKLLANYLLKAELFETCIVPVALQCISNSCSVPQGSAIIHRSSL